MVGGLEVAVFRGAARRAFSTPALWLIAFCLVASEAGCNVQARDYPEGVAAELRIDRDAVSLNGRPMPEQFEDVTYFINQGPSLLADGIVLLRGRRNATGAEAIGAVLGTWAAAGPAALLLLVLGAWLLPGYYRGQVGDGKAEKTFRPGTVLFRRVLAVRVMTALTVAGAAALGAAPGVILLVFAGLEGVSWVASIGVIVTLGGTVGSWLYVQAGVLFADREVVLSEIGPIAGLQLSWSRARGRRLRRLTWAFGAWIIEVIGAFGWFAWFVGFFTHPIARAASDTLLTRLYLEEASWCASELTPS